MRLNFIFIFIFIFLAQNSSWANENDLFELGEIEFSNRAKCAAQSKKPAHSAFLLVSNVDAAKAVYRLAKFRGDDVDETVKLAIDKFRYSVLELTKLIHHKLVTRELPLLPADLTREGAHIPHRYRSVMNTCKMGQKCPALDDYLEKIWTISEAKISTGQKFLKLYDVDNYHSQQSYITSDNFKTNNYKELGCAYLKKFGPMQAQLYGTKPTLASLTAIGQATINAKDNFASCLDFESQDNLQVAGYQIQLPALKTSLFSKKDWDDHYGFDYWNSLKIYLSFAYRKAKVMDELAFPYAPLFRGVNLEESVMLVSRGCKSLTKPECDGYNVALNSIREFAKDDFEENAIDLDILSETPDGAATSLLDDMIPSVNVDELDFAVYDNASKWLENFSGNVASARTLIKKRLIKGLSNLNIIKSKYSPDQLLYAVDEQFSNFFSKAGIELDSYEKNELYYLCSEYSFSQHEKWSFVRENLNILKESEVLSGLTRQLTKESSGAFFDYFIELGDKINKACYGLRQHDVWDEDFTLDREGFASWYTGKVYDYKVKSKYDERLEQYLSSHEPLISYKQYKDDASLENVVCAHPLDCARKVIKGILSIQAATEYASTFWSMEKKIQSPDLFNPYAQRVACKVYDPWYKTKATILTMMWDMGQAAASAFVPGMIYTKAELQPRMVTSLRKMIKDGQIEYDARYSEQKILVSLAADFGPLLGVPCAVSINRNENNPLDPLRFNGVSVGACNSESDNNLLVESASEIGDNQSSGHSECLKCSLNFESISGVAAHITQNVGPVYFIVRGLYQLYKSLKDPFNIPRSWEVNPYYAAETLVLYGEVPKKCQLDLRNGRNCLEPCAEAISEKLEEHLVGHITEFNLSDSRTGKVRHSSCPESEISFTKYERSSNSRREASCSVKNIRIPRSCGFRK